jgi:2-polyprenyl-6-methoxyphenol hydroxylase-like FAD-dependent oxidoreductase
MLSGTIVAAERILVAFTADHHVPVLVVGGSLVGMSTAMLLGHHGVRALVVEHHRGTAIHPRAAQISQRTMEIFRSVGLEDIIRNRSAEQFVQDGAIMAVETLAGRELAWFIANLNEGVRDVSPTERVFVSQSLLEPVLKGRAEALGADLRFGTDMMSFEQDEEGVTAVMRGRDSGKTETVRASYMVAADGAHSGVRQQLGIGETGRGVFSNSVTIYFRGDVAPLLRGRNLSVIYVSNASLRGFFRIEKPFDRGFLAVNATGSPDSPVTDVATGITEKRCRELVRLALGADVDVTIENVMPWKAAASLADRFAHGRVFLVGDAAHIMPPNGGFGGNTGVQDAHNLAWKLAMTLGDAGRAHLLSTYEDERRPVAGFTVEQAYSRYVTRTAPYLGTQGIEPAEADLNVELGYGYRSAAIVPGQDGSPASMHANPRETRARPGTRAPHVWLQRNGGQISTLDLYGSRFVLLSGTDGTWCEPARRAAARLAVPLDVHRIGDTVLENQAGDFGTGYDITAAGAVIIRPDGFVGWRSRTSMSDQEGVIERVLRSLTGSERT